eukprot:scaffold31814_cov165-Amphora_coffeaeformis.AAC.1
MLPTNVTIVTGKYAHRDPGLICDPQVWDRTICHTRDPNFVHECVNTSIHFFCVHAFCLLIVGESQTAEETEAISRSGEDWYFGAYHTIPLQTQALKRNLQPIRNIREAAPQQQQSMLNPSTRRPFSAKGKIRLAACAVVLLTLYFGSSFQEKGLPDIRRADIKKVGVHTSTLETKEVGVHNSTLEKLEKQPNVNLPGNVIFLHIG